WNGIDYRSGSSGVMRFARVRYANTGIYIRNASPSLSDVAVEASSSRGIELYASSNETTSPSLTNIRLVTGDPWTDAVWMTMPSWATNAVMAPVVNGGLIQLPAGSSGSVLYLSGAGVTPSMSNLTLAGGTYGMRALNGAAPVLKDSLVLNAASHGIILDGAGAGGEIIGTLVRGHGGAGIALTANQTTPPLIANNLIVENTGAGISLASNTVSLTGAVADLYSNTVADNQGVGLFVDAYASANAYDNILAFNAGGDVQATGTLSEDYNLAATPGVLAGVNDIYADPLFVANWFVSPYTAAPALDAIDADPTRSAQALAYLTANPYAETTTADVGALDLGYHHVQPAPLVDAANSVVSPTALTLPVGGTGTIIVQPLDANTGLPIGAGLKVTATVTNNVPGNAGSIGTVRDLGDGRYAFTFSASWQAGGSATVGFTVNGNALTPTVSVSW
ncbi:MAG: right-handed parallel beta-helix repeat-containing protein, partial [Mariprofundaceae bacterium]